MVFALLVLPACATALRAAARMKKHYRSRKAAHREMGALQKELKDNKNRAVCTFNVMLTKKEADAIDDTVVGQFLADRQISDDAADFLQGRV